MTRAEKLIIAALLTTICIVCFAVGSPSPADYAACEKTHSHDTCFYTLNR